MENTEPLSSSFPHLSSALHHASYAWERTTSAIQKSRRKLYLLSLPVKIIGIFYPKCRSIIHEEEENLYSLEAKLKEIPVTLPDTLHGEEWDEVMRAFEALKNSRKVWDIISSKNTDSVNDRTAAVSDVVRKEVYFEYRKIPYINSDRTPISLPEINGTILYLYPAFTVMLSGKTTVIAAISELEVKYEATDYIESGEIPPDSFIHRYTWNKANLDGTMDKRFRRNEQLPIVRYGLLVFETDTYRLRLMVSNKDSAEKCSRVLQHYLSSQRNISRRKKG